MSSDESADDDGNALVGLSLPIFGAPAGGTEEDDDEDDSPSPPQPAEPGADVDSEDDGEEEESAGPTGVSAEQAFASNTMDSLELDPFRRAAGAEVPDREPEEATGKKGKKAGYVPQGHISQRKLFVGGLAPETTDASLLKAAVRYGKVQEAVVVRTDGGKSRGFGFVTFVSHKGANYIIKEAGDEGKVTVDGRQCTVRASEDKQKGTEGLHKLPARGNLPQSKPATRERQAPGDSMADGSYGGSMEDGIGVSSIAGAHRRAPWEEDEVEPAEGARPKKSRKRKEEIVTVTRRQDAEPLDKRPITMKELFPKEFWRV